MNADVPTANVLPRLAKVGASGRSGDESCRVVFDISALNVYYGSFGAVRDVALQVYENEVTAHQPHDQRTESYVTGRFG